MWTHMRSCVPESVIGEQGQVITSERYCSRSWYLILAIFSGCNGFLLPLIVASGIQVHIGMINTNSPFTFLPNNSWYRGVWILFHHRTRCCINLVFLSFIHPEKVGFVLACSCRAATPGVCYHVHFESGHLLAMGVHWPSWVAISEVT